MKKMTKKALFLLLTGLLCLCLVLCACQKGETPEEKPPKDDDPAVTEPTVTPSIEVNQSNVVLCVGDSFTLQATTNVKEDVSWQIDGDSAEDVVALQPSGNKATVTAVKVGVTKVVVSVEAEGKVYFRTVVVAVNAANDVSFVLNNVGFDKDGYLVRLSVTETDNGSDVTSVVPTVSVYQSNKILSGVTLSWQSDDESVVTVSGNRFEAVAEGKTRIIGSCVIGGKSYRVLVGAEVYRPEVKMSQTFTVEVENVQPLAVEGTVRGIPQKVTLDGATVGQYNAQSGIVTLQKSQLPTASAQLGENRKLVIETNAAKYAFDVAVYTKIIKTKQDFVDMADISKACAKEAYLWDGYFVLGNDIVFNDHYTSKLADNSTLYSVLQGQGQWSNGGLYGFKGTFDGKGHNVEGVSIDAGSSMGAIFGVTHIQGVIQNVSFTKAKVAANSSFVTCAGGGTVRNVYIQFDSVGKGAQRYESNGSINNYCGAFFSFKEPTVTANVSYCVVDVSDAAVYNVNSLKAIGSELATITNTVVIGGTDAVRDRSNANIKAKSVSAFLNDAIAQYRYASFDEDFWSKVNGVPVSKAVYEQVKNDDVAFLEKPQFLLAGSAYALQLDNKYVTFECDTAGVTFADGAITLPESAADTDVTVTARSFFDQTKADSFTAKVFSLSGAVQDITSGGKYAYYDLTEGKVYFADLSDEISGDVLYFTDTDGSAASFPTTDGQNGTLIAVTKEKLYKFNYRCVTKVISVKEDLHYLRNDHTTTSYGNSGCYDGVISGTFVLLNDIDCGGLILENTGYYWENSRGFQGTFEGNGHTLSNLTVSKNGLFGSLSYATIRNVNFTNVVLAPVGGLGEYVALFADRIFNSVISDVNVTFASNVYFEDSVWHSSGLLYYEASFDSVFENIRLDVTALEHVKFVLELEYDAELPYLSETKSTYRNVVVAASDLSVVEAVYYTSPSGDAVTQLAGVTVVVED